MRVGSGPACDSLRDAVPPSGRGRMVEPRQARSPVQRAWTLVTMAALALASVGCTMCPDPFDYSGPVPNGSATQNDFRARSHGILPLGASPTPWPLIVKEGGDPTVAESTPTPADDATDEELRQTVAVVSESADEVEPEQVLASADREADALQPTLTPVPAVDTAKNVAVDVPGPVQPPQSTVVPAAAPTLPLGETPGWRARRR
jgi:hypothetical protein